MRLLKFPIVFTAVLIPLMHADVATYKNLPMQFEFNAGQTDASVKFLSRGPRSAFFITPEAVVLSLRPSKQGAMNVRMSLAGGNARPALSGIEPLRGKVNYLRGNDRSRWHTGIATFSKVKYGDVYPGIDMLYYGGQGRLEYDFVVAPGADPKLIRMRFDGARPSLNQQGQLVLTGATGQIGFEKPAIYQIEGGVRRPVAGGFALVHREAGFWIGAYDHTRELVIDPVLVYASYLGGTQVNSVNGVAPNSRGELYVTGYTLAVNFPIVPGAFQPAPAKCKPGDCDQAGGPDAFVSKFSADGTRLLYSTYLGGNNEDVGRAVAVDTNDNVWVTGYTYSNDFPLSSDAMQKLCSPAGVFSFATNTFTSLRASCETHPAGEANVYSQGAPDVFLTKLNPNGNQLLYSSFLGGTQNDNPVAIALDAQGNIYIAGSTSSVARDVYPPGGSVPYPETPNAFQTDVSDYYGFVSFLTKLSPDAHTLLYSTIIGAANTGNCGNGTCGNFATSMAVGQNGIVTIGGVTSSAQFPTKSALQTKCATGPNGVCYQAGFISAIDTTRSGAASLLYSTYLNGTAPAQSTSMVRGVSTDPQGNIYATGQTTANDFPTTPGTLSPACPTITNSGNCNNAFISKLNSAGSLVWSTYYGATASCCTVYGVGIATDASRNVYVAGQNGGAFDLPQKDPFQAGERGGEDVFLVTLSPDGSQVLFGSYFGGTGNDIVTGLALDAAGNIYFGGYTTSTDLPVTPGAVQIADPGYQQGFAAKVTGLPVAAVPVITPNGIVSASAFGGFNSAAPGSWIEIYGANLSPTTRQWGSADFNGPNAPTSLGGVQVKVGGQLAFVDYVSPTQVNALIPSTAATGQTTITVTNSAGTSAGYPITLNPVQPGLLAPPAFHLNGQQYVAALLADGVTFAGIPSRPAKPGDTLVIYGVGFGPVTPAMNAGVIVSQQNSLTMPLQILFGTTPATVNYQGLASGYTSLYQFNVVVPPLPDDPATPLTFTVGGQPGAQALSIAIQQ